MILLKLRKSELYAVDRKPAYVDLVSTMTSLKRVFDV